MSERDIALIDELRAIGSELVELKKDNIDPTLIAGDRIDPINRVGIFTLEESESYYRLHKIV